MDKMLKFAVISDLHIGSTARSSDLDHEVKDSPWRENNFLSRFESFVTEGNITADYLLIPGDITNKAEPKEFELASEVIKKIAALLGVSEQCVYFVPGNHDKNWGMHDAGDFFKDCERISNSYKPLLQEGLVFNYIVDRSSYSPIEAPYFYTNEDDNLIVIAINSAAHDGKSELGDSTPHYGLVSDETLLDIERFLANKESELREKIGVVLVHHHPLNYSNPLPHQLDFSAMVNAENLLDLLSKYSIDLLVHGHKHNPRFDVRINSLAHPLLVMASGSFCSALDPLWAGSVGNQFHLIEVHSRCDQEDALQGKLLSWAYFVKHGWMPSVEKTAGISHVKPFGYYPSQAVLKAQLKKDIELYMQDNEYLHWATFVAEMGQFLYCAEKAVLAVLEQLEREMGIVLSSPDDLDNLIIVNGKSS